MWGAGGIGVMERDNWVLLNGRCSGYCLHWLLVQSLDVASFEAQYKFTLGHGVFLFSSG